MAARIPHPRRKVSLNVVDVENIFKFCAGVMALGSTPETLEVKGSHQKGSGSSVIRSATLIGPRRSTGIPCLSRRGFEDSPSTHLGAA